MGHAGTALCAVAWSKDRQASAADAPLDDPLPGALLRLARTLRKQFPLRDPVFRSPLGTMSASPCREGSGAETM